MTDTGIAAFASLIYDNRERLPMFVIYDRPTDFPNSYVARLWLTLPEQQATNFIIRSTELEPLRQAMEDLGLAQLHRFPEDDAKIVETWV